MEFLRAHAAKIAIGIVTLFIVLIVGEQLISNRTNRMNTSVSDTPPSETTSREAASSSPASTPVSEAQIPVYSVEVLRTIPHDTQAFTQGLAFDNGELYESTGQYGSSSLRKLDPQTGKVLKKASVDAAYFAEGMVVVGGKAYQLTWQSGIGFIYDSKTFRQERTFSYFGEGWGLSYDGESLIMSDGTSSLRFLDVDSLLIRKMLPVTANGVLVKNLNELEVVKGEIWANIWQTDSIARINPQTGKVVGWIDCTGLLTPEERANADVLNGIAYDAKRDVLLITGKNWSKMFEVRVKLKEKM
ncbi:MAG: glutaminyl-peptide cyclotransferase [Candidatus Kapabacteria bacterium]|jgi:glutamine cyclotransferase|nr:glutaminyl-peptide cyclotransferase [Candidatus Kapabacteria bacterium]